MDEEEVKVEEEVKKVILSVTSNSVKRQGAARRNSTGKANARTSPTLLNKDEKILPHYLRASTNSCHEFCKYGKKHVFEPKKWKPNQRRDSGSSEIPAEGQKAEFSAPRSRRKKPELKAKTEPKDGLLEKLPTPPFQGHIASFVHSPFEKDDGSSEEPSSIETLIPSPVNQIEELSDTSEATNPEISSPTEKRVIISHEPITPIAWPEKSSDGSESMDLELPSPVRTPKSQVEGSPEEPLGVEILAPAPGIDESIRSNSAAPSSAKKSLKPVTPTRWTASFAKARPPNREEKSSEKGLSAKLKTPSPNPRGFAGNEGGNLMKNLKNVQGKNSEVNKVKASPQLQTEVSVNAKVVREKRIGVIAKPTVENRTVTPVKPKVSERKSLSSMKKVIIPVSPRVTKQKTSPTIRRADTPSKPLMSLKPKAPAVKSTPSPISLRRLSGQGSTGNKIIRSSGLSKLGEDTAPKPSSASVSAKTMLMKSRSLKPSLPAKVQRKSGKLENASSSSSSSPSSVSSHEKEENEYSESTLSEASQLILNREKTNRSKPVQSAKREEKRTPIRTAPAAVRTEARVPSPHKLNFRRGKIVSPMPENNSPRKLKFRKARGTSESSKEAVKRTFRRRRMSCGSASELIVPSLLAPEVALRHQDVQEKKDVQGLFNHVIEETANKLVEAKKSKVRALVGAFETVISLQERQVFPTV